MKSDLVSVIIPTYNRAHTIVRAIKSVLNQSYKDIEIIVVDDGSTDNTEEIVKSFQDERIIYIKYSYNKGGAAARNSGIKIAKGEYVAFQDSDDEWAISKLQRQMDVIEKSQSKVKLVYTTFWKERNGKLEKIASMDANTKRGKIHEDLLRNNFIDTPTVILHKSCFERAGLFDERLPCYQDWELWIRISKYYEFKYIDEPLVISHYTSNSISTDRNALYPAQKLILEKHYEEIKKNRKLLARHQYSIGSLLCHNGKIDEGRNYILRALRSYPLNPKYIMAVFISLFGSKVYNKVIKIKA